MSSKYLYLLTLLGLVLSGWGGGMISVGYIIGDVNPINTINAFGLIILGLGLAITIATIRGIKKDLVNGDLEVTEEID